MKIIDLSEDTILNICNMYLNENKSSVYISKLIGLTSHQVRQILRENNIKINRSRRRPVNDLTGRIFGDLTVLKRGENTNTGRNRVTWICLCVCGKEKQISRSNLIANHHSSCGCKRKLEEGEANFNVLFRLYKRNAKNRSYEFNLTSEQFRLFTKSNCFYCERPPSNIMKNSRKSNGSYIYNGIDRLDNSKGYTLENCVAACDICNFAKSDKDIKYFYDWLVRLNNNFEKLKEKLCLNMQE